MTLPSRRRNEDWSALVGDMLRSEKRGAIEIFDPALETVPVEYDPVTNTGGDPVRTRIWAAPANVRSASAKEYAANPEWGTRRAFVISIDLNDDMPFLRKGLEVAITDGANDKALERIALTLTSATGSTSAAERTIYAVSDVAEISG